MRAILAVAILVAALPASADDLSGSYSGTSDGAAIELKLQQTKDGTATGSMTSQGFTLRLSGRITGNKLTGTIVVGDEKMPMTAILS